jgi:hypothetical protein
MPTRSLFEASPIILPNSHAVTAIGDPAMKRSPVAPLDAHAPAPNAGSKPVLEMHIVPMEVRGAVAYVARSTASPVLGKDRRGYRGASIVAAIGARDATIAGHFVERDTRLINGMESVGRDNLTARDQAIYELMLAVAREEGVERDFHQIDVRAIARFLRARRGSTKGGSDCRLDRLMESIDRLTGTIVRYRHRNRYGATYAPGPLIKAEIHVDRATGRALLDYSLSDPVKHAIDTSRSYTWLELDAFAGFSNRYTARLYRHLALRAGYDGSLGKRWAIAPAELAGLLNYPLGTDGTLHMSSFERRCLIPAMADIHREVRGFSVSVQRTAKAHRGASDETLVFEIVRHEKPLHHHKAADVAGRLAPLAAAGRYPADHLPSRLLLGRAQTMTGHAAEKLLEGWHVALDRAKADPQTECIPGLAGYVLLQTIRWQDADRAFAEWAKAVHRHGSIPAPVRIYLHPVDPGELEPSMRLLVKPSTLQALRGFAGKLIGRRSIPAMEALLAGTLDEKSTRLVAEADAAVGGRLFAACRHAAALGLDYRQWGLGVMLLTGGRPAEAIEALDELLTGTACKRLPADRSALSERPVAVDRSVQPPVAEHARHADPLHEPPDLSGLMEDAEPPIFHLAAGEQLDDPDETDSIPY